MNSDTTIIRLMSALADRYRDERELGRVLAPELSASISVERFTTNKGPSARASSVTRLIRWQNLLDLVQHP